MARFLIVQPAFLGDLVLTLPLVARLREKYPQSEVHLLVRQEVTPLLEGHPWINRVWGWDKSWRGWFRVYRQLRLYSWEGIWVVQRFARAGLLGWLLPASFRVTYDKSPLSFLYTYRVPHRFAEGEHETRRVLRLGGVIGLSEELPPPPWLFPPPLEIETASPYIVVSPTSRWATKEAPFSYWQNFLRQVPEKLTIYLTGMPSDRERLEQLVPCHPRIHNMAGRLTLSQLAALVQGARRVYSVDSALTHIASALGVPATVVFCSTVPAFGFGPLAPGSSIVEVEEPLLCRPCGIHGKRTCPLSHFRCGRQLPLPPLLASLNEALLQSPHTSACPLPPAHTAPSP
ncbi:MAG: glycosyltransferase family 9 protein [Bacteroidia bacterium]|nr:glycosyltransferase family 9 protein [Bacteroidia bacterium]